MKETKDLTEVLDHLLEGGGGVLGVLKLLPSCERQDRYLQRNRKG